MATWLIKEPQRMALEGDVSRLDVWLAHGKLRVVGTDGPPRLEVKRVGKTGVTVDLTDGVLSIRHDVKKFGWRTWIFGGWRRFTADMLVAVPSTTVGSLSVVSGSIVASGLRQGASVDVTSGSITLMGLGGTVRAKTVSGSIEAMGVGGDLSVQTVSGEISLAESSAERVVARTISGAVTCDLDNPEAHDVRIDTTSGEITVRVPSDADLDVHLGATSGRVTSAFPEVRSFGGPGHRSANGRIGRGRGTLQAYAVSGSVSLLARPSESFGGPSASSESSEGPGV